ALHGEADARLPVDLPRRAVEGLVAAGCDARLQTWPGVGHEVSPDMQRALYAELDRLLPR
ncbi:MAG TPA: esterase, partial [Myxococcota bacterium]|nr:esterase [Myxococcota bacterium]